MHGDYDKNEGHDGITFDIVTNDKKNYGAGHWTEWRENAKFGKTVVFANASLIRIGKCHKNFDVENPATVEHRFLLKGGVAADPMESGQEPMDMNLQ